MRINANDYLEAARDRIVDAHSLYSLSRFSFSLYAAGLAIESMLRAYRILKDPHFEERHDLRLLFAESGMEDYVTTAEHTEVFSLVFTIFLRWKYDLRFASENRLKRRLKKLRLDRGIRGNFIKENCRLSVEAANKIVRIEVARWPQSSTE